MVRRAIRLMGIGTSERDDAFRRPNDAGYLNWWTTWSADQAYMLGFIFADGSVREGRDDLVIAQKDRDYLLRLMDIVPGHDKRVIPHGNREGMWSLRLHIRGLRDALGPFGIVPLKTYVGWFPADIPDEYFGHYVRGFLDGDGCISKVKARKRGNVNEWNAGFYCFVREFLVALSDRLMRYGVAATTVYPHKALWSIKYGSRGDLEKLYALLYEGATLYLERKHKVFREAMDYFQQNLPYGSLLALTPEQVAEIRELYGQGKGTHRSLAKVYGVNPTTIRNTVLDLTDGYRNG
jgi:hypothetical protein